MRFPVYLLRERIGEISMERIGLYWEYRAALLEELPGFVRLYVHCCRRTVPLGLFREKTLQGRISVRSAQLRDGLFAFSVLPDGFLPPESLQDKAPLPFCARRCGNGWEYCIPIEEVNEEVLPYFCFFHASSVYGRSCVRLTQDLENKPCFPQLSP